MTRPVCAIAGESGAGKTTLARALVHRLEGALILHQDDYFHLPPTQTHARRQRDLGVVGPGEVDLGRLRDHIAAFRAGAPSIDAPVLAPGGDSFTARPTPLEAVCFLIVEGTYAMRLPADLRIFVSGTYRETLAARLARGRDPIDALTDRILAIEHDAIAPDRELADIVV
jgi:uridine kinase